MGGISFGAALFWIAVGVVVAIGVVMAINKKIEDTAKSHIVTIESFKTAGITLCERLHGGTNAYETCIAEVMAEWSRALANRDGFNTGNVPSIPAGSWP